MRVEIEARVMVIDVIVMMYRVVGTDVAMNYGVVVVSVEVRGGH